MLIHVRQRHRGGVGGGGGGAASTGSMMYTSSRVGGDIRTVMVDGNRQHRGRLCAACSGDGVDVGYQISKSGSMPSNSHGWLAIMDGGYGGHGPSPWRGHLGRSGAGNTRTAGGTGGVCARDADGVGALGGGATGGAADDTTEHRERGATFARRGPLKRCPTGKCPRFLSRSWCSLRISRMSCRSST